MIDRFYRARVCVKKLPNFSNTWFLLKVRSAIAYDFFSRGWLFDGEYIISPQVTTLEDVLTLKRTAIALIEELYPQ